MTVLGDLDDVFALYPGFHVAGDLPGLNRLAATVTEGVIVAIGSNRGQSDIALALNAQVPVYCVDPHIPSDDYPFSDEDRVTWMQNVLRFGLGAKLRPINLKSLDAVKAWSEPIGMLWIDGSHTQAKEDTDAWLPFVIEGGLIVYHDTQWPLVPLAYQDRTDLVKVEEFGICIAFRKRSNV